MTDFKIDTTQYNQVDYFGLILSVPKQYEYIATDADGDVYAYKNIPLAVIECFNSHLCAYIRNIEYTGDWKQSLKRVSDILINKTVNENGWISVEDALPDYSIPVIAGYFRKGEFVWWFFERFEYGDGWCWSRFDNSFDDAYADEYDITYWRPLPNTLTLNEV